MAPCLETETCHSPSRTEKYKKVLKPLLERRRRARINSCLDDLKELLSEVAEVEGDSSRLEKADILELAVTHLRRIKDSKLRQPRSRPVPAASNPLTEMARYRAGFSAAATVVSRALASVPGVDVQLGSCVMQQLGVAYQALDERRLSAPLSVQVPSYTTRVPVSSGGSSSCVSPAGSCSSGYSSCTESGLLTVAPRHSPAPPAAMQTFLQPQSQQLLMDQTSCSLDLADQLWSEDGLQTQPLNLVAGEEDMWRPW